MNYDVNFNAPEYRADDYHKMIERRGREMLVGMDFGGMNCRHSSWPGMTLDICTVPTIKNIMVNGPATIVFLEDGTKTVVKVSGGDKVDLEKGVLLAYMKKVYGNGYYRELQRKLRDSFEDWLEENKLLGGSDNVSG